MSKSPTRNIPGPVQPAPERYTISTAVTATFRRLRKRTPHAEVEIHEEDAKSLGLQEGDMVKVTSKQGSITLPVKIMQRGTFAKGAVQITHGFADANANLLTDDTDRCPISGFPGVEMCECED